MTTSSRIPSTIMPLWQLRPSALRDCRETPDDPIAPTMPAATSRYQSGASACLQVQAQSLRLPRLRLPKVGPGEVPGPPTLQRDAWKSRVQPRSGFQEARRGCSRRPVDPATRRGRGRRRCLIRRLESPSIQRCSCSWHRSLGPVRQQILPMQISPTQIIRCNSADVAQLVEQLIRNQ